MVLFIFLYINIISQYLICHVNELYVMYILTINHTILAYLCWCLTNISYLQQLHGQHQIEHLFYKASQQF